MSRSVPSRERGQASLEVIASVAVVLFFVLLAAQVFSAMYVGQAADRIAWDAARAHSLGQSAASAAHASAPGGIRVTSVSTFADGVRVTVTTPEFIPVPRIGPVTRTAYVP